MFQREGSMCFGINNIIYEMFTALEMLTKGEIRDLGKHYNLIIIATAFVINNVNRSMP